MSSEPSDETIENEIKATVASMKVHMKPNKLRKIICKKIPSTNWTQYQRVLDAMTSKNIIQTSEYEGEVVIISSSTDSNVPPPPEQDLSKVLKADMEVPFEIIRYLTRKGRKKQKNIEANTKSKITFDDATTKAIRTNSARVPPETETETGTATKTATKTETDTQNKCLLTITRAWNCRDEEDEREAEEKAKKQMKTAKLHIQKILKSFKDNPERFAEKKAGGTLKEQAEAKKQKLEAANKKKSFGKDKKNKALEQKEREGGDGTSAETGSQKKKRRKFY